MKRLTMNDVHAMNMLKRLEKKEPNDPLTPEELLGMEGEPVFLSGDGLDRWNIFCGVSTDGLACFLRGALPMDGRRKTWTPYRSKLEEAHERVQRAYRRFSDLSARQ